jgi:hypothetical protein
MRIRRRIDGAEEAIAVIRQPMRAGLAKRGEEQ